MDIWLVIVTLILVFVTGFYTYNLSRIELFDKRYKIYESLIRLLENIDDYNKLINIKKNIGDKSSIEFVLDDVKNSPFRRPFEAYKYNLEASRFLYSEEIYKFLDQIETEAKLIDIYFDDYVTNHSGDADKRTSAETAIRNICSNYPKQTIADKFLPYLKYEENILIFYRNYLCKLCSFKP